MRVVWSPKGGVGSTSIAIGLAWRRAEVAPSWLIDVHGGVAAVLGVESATLGLADWADATDAPDDALARLTREVAPGVGLLGPGTASIGGELDVRRLRSETLAVGPTVIVDAGTHPVTSALVAAADRSTMVLRNCGAAVAMAVRCPIVADEVFVIVEPGRALRGRDVERALDVPAVEVPFVPAMAGATDVGLSRAGVPRRLARALRVA